MSGSLTGAGSPCLGWRRLPLICQLLSAGARVIMVPDTIEPTDEIREKVDAIEPDLEAVIEWISRENK